MVVFLYVQNFIDELCFKPYFSILLLNYSLYDKFLQVEKPPQICVAMKITTL